MQNTMAVLMFDGEKNENADVRETFKGLKIKKWTL